MNIRPAWRARAACRGSSPALFYDAHPDAVAAAKAVCAGCVVREHCDAQARAAGEEYGVWGGRTADERLDPVRGQFGVGARRRIGDDELRDLFANADPDCRAFDQLFDRTRLPTATAYRALQRAVQLGVVERRGRGLFPLRR